MLLYAYILSVVSNLDHDIPCEDSVGSLPPNMQYVLLIEFWNKESEVQVVCAQ